MKPPGVYQIFFELFVKDETAQESQISRARLATKLWESENMERIYAQELHRKLTNTAPEVGPARQSKNKADTSFKSQPNSSQQPATQESMLAPTPILRPIRAPEQELQLPSMLTGASPLQQFFLMRHVEDFERMYRIPFEPTLQAFRTLDVLFRTLNAKEWVLLQGEFSQTTREKQQAYTAQFNRYRDKVREMIQ